MRIFLSLCFVAIFSLFGTSAAAQSPKVQLGLAVKQGEVFEKQGKVSSAIESYSRALVLARQIFGPQHINVAALLKMIGDLHRKSGEYARAEPLFLEALQICEGLNETDLAREVLSSLASGYVEQAKYPEALELQQRCLAMMVKRYGAESPQAAIISGNLAQVYKALGDEKEAERLYRRAIAIQERTPEQKGSLSVTLMNLATILSNRGEYTLAEPTLRRSIELAEQVHGKSHFEVALIRNNLGVLYQAIGQYPQAEAVHREVLKSVEAALGENHPSVARSLNNLGIVLEKQKRFEEAERCYRRALRIRQVALGEDHPDTVIGMETLSNFLVQQGAFEEAETLIRQGLAFRKQRFGNDHPEVASSLMGLGFLRVRQNRLDEALEFYQQSLSLRQRILDPTHPDIGYSHAAVAGVLAEQGKTKAAGESYLESRKALRRYIGSVLPGLSEPEQLTFLKEVDERIFHNAIGLALQSSDTDIHELTAEFVLNGKGVAQEALAQRALMAWDRSDPELTIVVNRMRAIRRRLASLMHVGGREDSAAVRESVAALVKEEEKCSKELLAKSGRNAASSEWVELARIRTFVPDDAVLVEIVRVSGFDFRKNELMPARDRYGAWLIPSAGPDRVQFVDLGDVERIEAAVRKARESLNGSLETIRESGEQEAEAALRPDLEALSRLILQPLIEKLKDRQTILLSPDSLLWLVPWSALPAGDVPYAIERFDIRYLVSGRDLVHSELAVSEERPILIADPNFDLEPKDVRAAAQRLYGARNPISPRPGEVPSGTSRLGTAPRLPGTRAEAEAISPQVKSYAGLEPYVYTDEYALEAVFKGLRRPRVLVVSTHGFFQGDDAAGPPGNPAPHDTARPAVVNPLVRCGLLLTGCNKPEVGAADVDDGILTGIEIIETDLRGTDLVVLSACETGVGAIRNGEGVAGLRQAFQLAGARSVVATLWQIPDRETTRLMTSFFTRLAQSGAKSPALREAQLAIIRSRRDRNAAAHPFFWAAFTLTGD